MGLVMTDKTQCEHNRSAFASRPKGTWQRDVEACCRAVIQAPD